MTQTPPVPIVGHWLVLLTALLLAAENSVQHLAVQARCAPEGFAWDIVWINARTSGLIVGRAVRRRLFQVQ